MCLCLPWRETHDMLRAAVKTRGHLASICRPRAIPDVDHVPSQIPEHPSILLLSSPYPSLSSHHLGHIFTIVMAKIPGAGQGACFVSNAEGGGGYLWGRVTYQHEVVPSPKRWEAPAKNRGLFSIIPWRLNRRVPHGEHVWLTQTKSPLTPTVKGPEPLE